MAREASKVVTAEKHREDCLLCEQKRSWDSEYAEDGKKLPDGQTRITVIEPDNHNLPCYVAQEKFATIATDIHGLQDRAILHAESISRLHQKVDEIVYHSDRRSLRDVWDRIARLKHAFYHGIRAAKHAYGE